MKTIRSTLAAILVLVVWLLSAHGQEKPLSPKAQRLADALIELQKRPNDPVVQERYLNSFPRDYKTFLSFFDLDRELQDGHDYIHVLPALAKDRDSEVGWLLIGLSRDAHYEADAPGYLQQATAVYASQHTESFVKLLGRLSPKERAHLITFLADVENHSAYSEYQEIIDRLNSLGQKRLAAQFEMAREKRKRQPHG